MNHHNTLIAMLRYALSVAIVLTLAVTCWADDITGEETFLCSSASVHMCAWTTAPAYHDGAVGSRRPGFHERVDLKKAQAVYDRIQRREPRHRPRRRRASSMGTSICTVWMATGCTAWSLTRPSGFITAAIARDGLTVTVFGCVHALFMTSVISK